MRCGCGFAAKLDPRSAAYHRAHRVVHLEVYPHVDAMTRANLDALVHVFERREAAGVLQPKVPT